LSAKLEERRGFRRAVEVEVQDDIATVAHGSLNAMATNAGLEAD
jgi:hypothetical protein